MNRRDFKIISEWIKKESTVLDLGCGDSTLLNYLVASKDINGYGLEKDIEKVQESIKKDISVIQADFNVGLEQYFENNFFDYAIMTQALQENKNPDRIILEMLRVAKEGIVTFPNMGFWKNRFQLGFLGRMPISKSLPNNWFDTPNIHLCTLLDFTDLCAELDLKVAQCITLTNGRAHQSTKAPGSWQNLTAEQAVFVLQRS